MKLSLTTRLLVAVLTLFTTSCSNEEALAQTTSDMIINITIGDQTRTATLVSNSSTEALVAALQEAPISYEAHDYGNFEKVGDLGRSFPQNNTQTTTEPGDLILYQGNNLCIYYDTNSWNFTRLGRIDDATQSDIKEFVRAGQGNVTVTLKILLCYFLFYSVPFSSAFSHCVPQCPFDGVLVLSHGVSPLFQISRF